MLNSHKTKHAGQFNTPKWKKKLFQEYQCSDSKKFWNSLLHEKLQYFSFSSCFKMERNVETLEFSWGCKFQFSLSSCLKHALSAPCSPQRCTSIEGLIFPNWPSPARKDKGAKLRLWFNVFSTYSETLWPTLSKTKTEKTQYMIPSDTVLPLRTKGIWSISTWFHPQMNLKMILLGLRAFDANKLIGNPSPCDTSAQIHVIEIPS